MSDIVHAFQLSAVHKSGAIVAVDRLAWLNKQHVRAGLADVAAGGSAAMHAKAQRLLTDAYGPDLPPAAAAAAVALVRSRLNILADVVAEARFLFEEPKLPLQLLPSDVDMVRQFAAALQAAAGAVATDSAAAAAAAAAAATATVRAATKAKPPQLFPPLRLALTVPPPPPPSPPILTSPPSPPPLSLQGQPDGLPITDIVSGLGVHAALRRLQAAAAAHAQ